MSVCLRARTLTLHYSTLNNKSARVHENVLVVSVSVSARANKHQPPTYTLTVILSDEKVLGAHVDVSVGKEV